MKANSKEVRVKLVEHITEYMGKDGLTVQERVKSQIDYMKVNHESIYQTCRRLVGSGEFLGYYDDVRAFLETLNLNNKSNKIFDDTQVWLMYKYLIASCLERLYNGKAH